jgi:hypothetical protein
MTVSEQQLKEVVKSAIVKVLKERSDLIRNFVEEALENIGMSKAIQEGEDSALITRHQVFRPVEDQ